ncbi:MULTISPECIES: DegV family protein [Brevibacterium]|uniref:DegV family protein n=1 Tax=Brevibacterium TaxID=1696 RepID=UPI001EF5DFB2|nr:DegV family protein [Brevibacterium sp. ACRRH]
MTRGIIVDSTARLTPEDFEEFSAHCVLRTVDLTVRVGEEDRRDSAWTPTEVCSALRRGQRVATSMPEPDAFAHALHELEEAGVDDVLILTMSGEMSGTFKSARAAAASSNLPAEVVDSLTLSAGLVGAARVAAHTSGMELTAAAQEVAHWCRTGTRVAFIPESLDWLQAGGRIGAAAALIGKTLSIVPVLGLSDGRVVTRGKVRTRSKAVAKLADFVRESCDVLGGEAPVDIVVVHSEQDVDGANAAVRELVNAVAEVVAGLGADAQVNVETRVVSTVVTGHVGPGTVGVFVQSRPGG